MRNIKTNTIMTKEEFEELLREAEKGNAEAQYEVGECYFFGDTVVPYCGSGIKRDYAKAAAWLRKAAEQGNEDGQALLGDCYFNGYGVPQDYTKAIELFRKSAEKECYWGLRCLGMCYLEGKGVEQDKEKALDWLSKALQEGGDYELEEVVVELDAEIKRSKGISDEETDTKNAQEEFEELLKEAEKGNAKAQFTLGKCYMDGHDVDQDTEKAIEYFRKAAEQEYFPAQLVLWPVDAKAGEMYAQANLGVYYNNKGDKERDQSKKSLLYRRAAIWYRKAAEQGDEDSQFNLGMLYYKGNGLKKDYKKAVTWLTKVAKQGGADAQFLVGFCYWYGRGVKKNHKKGADWLNKSAAQGFEDAIEKLNYLKGKGLL